MSIYNVYLSNSGNIPINNSLVYAHVSFASDRQRILFTDIGNSDIGSLRAERYISVVNSEISSAFSIACLILNSVVINFEKRNMCTS